MKWALIFLLISQPSFASDCQKKVQIIQKGQPAQCDGFLFSDEAEKEAAQARDDVKYYKEINGLLERKADYLRKENDTANERLQNFIEQSRALSQQMHRNETYSDLQKFIYFAAGVAVTSVIVSNVNR